MRACRLKPSDPFRTGSNSLTLAPSKAKVRLHGQKTIPNKDFILRYDVTGKKLQDGMLAHRDERGGFFTLVLQPPDTVAAEDRTPKEIVFVLDTSRVDGRFSDRKGKGSNEALARRPLP